MKVRQYLFLLTVTLLSLNSFSAIACGEGYEPTEFQPLQLILSSDKSTYSKGEFLEFTLKMINVSQDSVSCPAEFHSSFLPSTEKPDGSCINYKCIPPAPDCSGEYAQLRTIVLGPGDEVEYRRRRPVSLFGDSGPYKWQYTLWLYKCPNEPYSNQIVAKTNKVLTVIVE